MNKRLALVLASLGVLAFAPNAQAQILYSATGPTTAAAPTRTGWTAITWTCKPVSCTANDSGGAVIALPFTFPFYGQNYTSLTATVDGLILFDNDANNIQPTATPGLKGCGWQHDGNCANTGWNKVIPDVTVPNNLIAFWWSDMVFSATGTAEWTVDGTAPNRIFALRYSGWGAYDSTGAISPRTVTTELHETSGQVDVYFGTMTGTTDPTNYAGASVGMEGLLVNAQVDGIAGLSCTNNVVAASSSRCRASSWPSGQMVSYAPSPDADLRIDSMTITSITGGITVNGHTDGFQAVLDVTVNNRGMALANGVDFDIYLTNNPATPTQTLMSRFSTGGGATFNLAGQTTIHKTITVQFERPGTGKFWFGGVVDPAAVVTEVIENNNTNLSGFFQVGADLVAASVTTTATGASFGQSIPVTFTVHNGGTDAIASFDVKFYISPSANNTGTGAAEVFTVSNLSLSGGLDYTATIQMPTNIGPGSPLNPAQYYIVMFVDPLNHLPELNENNNKASTPNLVAFGYADLYCVQSDFHVTSLTPNATGGYDELTQIYFGDCVRIAYKAGNKGTPAVDFDNGITITTGPNIKPPSTSGNFLATCTDLNGTGAPLDHLTYGNQMAATVYEVKCCIPSMDNATPPRALPESGPATNWIIGIYIDGWSFIPETDETESSNECKKPVTIRRPAMDLIANALDVPSVAAVGEVVPVTRVFSNLGNVPGAFQYEFVLSSNDVISSMDLGLPVWDGTTAQPYGQGNLVAGGSDRKTEFVMIPPEASPGIYYIGLLLDPENQVTELSKTNNALRSLGTIQVMPSVVNIQTQGLPDAVLGAPYYQQLMASGGNGGYVWDVIPGQGSLPDGITLTNDGVISGSPTVEGNFGCVVRATSGNQATLARLTLRVVNPTASLSIVSSQLPPAVRGIEYNADLVAMGGVRPYTWALAAGDALPAGLTLDPAGKIKGTPTTLVANKVLGVVVTDAHNSVVSGVVTMRVVDANALRIKGVQTGTGSVQAQLPTAQVGVAYTATFEAENVVGTAVWAIVAGTLPDGITLADNVLSGTPMQVGVYPISVEVQDDNHNRDVAPFVLVVMPRAARFDAVTLNAVTQGDSYLAELSIYTDATQNPFFELYSGQLPDGLQLTSGGRIAGVVAVDARVGTYDFVVKVSQKDGAFTYAALSIRVNAAQKASPVVPSSGCSSGGTGPLSLGVLMLLALPMLGRRRLARAPLALALVVGALATPGLARAGYAEPQVLSDIVGGFQEITNGTVVPLAPTNPATPAINLEANFDLPFRIRFFDNYYTEARIGCRGYITFDRPSPAAPSSAVSPSPTGIPSKDTTPWPLIAPWWGNWECASGQVTYAVTGISPNRVVTFQWKNVYFAPDSATVNHGATFQARIYETTWKIEFLYGRSNHGLYNDGTGATVGRAAVGIQASNANGVAGKPIGPSCTQKYVSSSVANCLPANWPENKYITFVNPIDLTITRVVSDPVLYAGVPARIGATVWNRGGEPTPAPTTVRFYLSTVNGASPKTTDPELGDAQPAMFDVDQTRTLMLAPTMPAGLYPGTYYLFAKVDPDNAITEDSEANNIYQVTAGSGGVPVTVGQPTADFVPGTITVTGMTPGGDVTVTINAAIRNAGNGDFGGGLPLRYRFYLSSNPLVTVGDIPLGSGVTEKSSVAISKFSETTVETGLTLDLGPLATGTWYIGMVVDPDGLMTAPEITKTNNFTVNGAAIPVVSLTVAISTATGTDTLPTAYEGLPYSARIIATGGTGSYVFSAINPLPAGLTLSLDGLVSGTPKQATPVDMPASFQVSVVSGTASALKTLTLMIMPGGIPLTVLSGQLPAGEFNHPYEEALIAVGGVAPYTWSLATGAALPPGLVLGPDGVVQGAPELDGSFAVDVEVTDSTAAPQTARGTLTIPVFAPTHVTVATTSIPSGAVGTAYAYKLQAVGGKPPYTWSKKTSFVKLPADASDPDWYANNGAPSDVKAGLPASLLLKSNGEINTNALSEVGAFAVTFEVSDLSGETDNATFVLRVTSDKQLRILTTALPDAIDGKPYNAWLFAEGPSQIITWVLTCEPTFDGDTYKPCVPGGLPPNFALESADGKAHLTTGTNNAVASDAAATVYTFMVKAVDDYKRTSVMAYSITVRKDPPAQQIIDPNASSCGCGFGAGSSLPAGFGIALVLGLGLLGRRRRPTDGAKMQTGKTITATLVGLGAVALVAAGCGAKQTISWDKCDKVQCEGELKCDPLDGVCKCGGEVNPDSPNYARGGVVCGAHGICANSVCKYECQDDRGTAITDADCIGGNSLDLVTCKCLCGGTDGVQCSPLELCDATTRVCVKPDPCEGLACSAGMTCDPLDGKCKCGGVACAAKETCQGGACKPDLCYGVNCLGDSICDADDGQCKCGAGADRQICAFGQSCECPTGQSSCAREARSCAASTRCANVECTLGSACDPFDGLCKCGGAGGRVCQNGQACDVVNKICIGDDLCRGVDCRDGMSCDAEDGLCKCGGRGGEVCTASQKCARWSDLGRCVTECLPYPGTDCPADKTCSFDPVAQMAFCVTPGTKPEQGGCRFHTADLATDCMKGLSCVKEPDKDFGTCYKYCPISDPFGKCTQTSGSMRCRALEGAPDAPWGQCTLD